MCDNIGANTQYRPIAAKLRKITKCETIDNKNPYPIIFLLISFLMQEKSTISTRSGKQLMRPQP